MPALIRTPRHLLALVLVAAALAVPRARAQSFDNDGHPTRRSSSFSGASAPTGFVVAPDDGDDEEDEEPQPKPKPARKSARPAPRDDADEEPAPAAPAPRRTGGSISITEESTAPTSTISSDSLRQDKQGHTLGNGRTGAPAKSNAPAVFHATPADDEDEDDDAEEAPPPRVQPSRSSTKKAAPPPRDTHVPTGFIAPTAEEEDEEESAPPVRPSARAAGRDQELRPSVLDKPAEPTVHVLAVPERDERPRSLAPIKVEDYSQRQDDTFIDSSGNRLKSASTPPKQPKRVDPPKPPPPEPEPVPAPPPAPKPAPPPPPAPKPVPPPAPKPEPKPEPKSAPTVDPASESEDADATRLLTGGRKPVVTAPPEPAPAEAAPASDPFEKLDREMRKLEGAPEQAPAPEPKKAPLPAPQEPPREEFKEPELAAKPLETPPPAPIEIPRDPSRLGLSVLAGAAPLVASDPRAGYTVDLAYGLGATWNPSFAGPFALDVSLFRATRSGGTPFVSVDSSYTHVATRVLYLKEQRRHIFAGFGAGLLLTMNTASYSVTDGATQQAQGSQLRAGFDGSAVAGLRFEPVELRVDLRALVRGGFRLDFLPTLSVGVTF